MKDAEKNIEDFYYGVIEPLGVQVKAIGKVDTSDINIGGLYLKANGNQFVFDTTKYCYKNFEEDGVDKSWIEMSLIIGEDFDDDDYYTLTIEELLDFKNNGLTVQLWIEEGDYEIEEAHFFFTYEGEQLYIPITEF